MPIDCILHLGKVTGYPTGSTTRTQCRANVLFPESAPYISNSVTAEDVFDFSDEAHFQIDNSSDQCLDALIAEPVRIILLAVSSDQRHQIPGFEFQIYLDPFLVKRHTTLEADLIGKHCENGEFNVSVTAPTLHVSFELAEPLITTEQAEGSAIMRLKIDELKCLPKAIILSTLHPDDKVHPFEYNVSFKFPCGRIVQVGSGVYTFEEPIENSTIKWEGCSRVFLDSNSITKLLDESSIVELEVWRTLSEDFASFPISDTISHFVDGRASLGSSELTKPGQSHYTGDIPLRLSTNDETPIRAPPSLSSSEDSDPRKSKGAKKPPSRASATRKKPKRAITAKDKKQIKFLQTQFSELTEADGFNLSSILTIDIQFSHPLVNKPLVPHATLKPSDLARHNPMNLSVEENSHHLEKATMEFKEAAQRLAYEVVAAQKMRQECQLAIPDFPDDIRPLLKKAPSFHIALEKLNIAISETFGEFSVANNAQTESQMELLLQILPMFLHDELAKQLDDCYMPAKKPIPAKTFLVRESEEAELMGRTRAATELLEELLAMDLGSAESWWLYASLMMKHGDLSRCEECVRRGLTCDPNHLNLSLLFASLLTRQQKYNEAIDFLENCHFQDKFGDVVLSILKSLANIPTKQVLDEGESPIQYIIQLLDLQDTVFAEQLIAEEQMAKGETPEVLYLFGRLHYILRDFAKAASFLSRALSIEKTADSALLLGHVEFERERYVEAAKRFEDGLEMRFEHGAALRLGFIYLKHKDWLKAESILFQCSPQSASVCLGLAIASFYLDKFKQADELLNRATVINCRHPITWAYIALLSEKLQRIDEALNAAENAMKWELDDEEMISKLDALNLLPANEEEEKSLDLDSDSQNEEEVEIEPNQETSSIEEQIASSKQTEPNSQIESDETMENEKEQIDDEKKP